MSTAVYAAEAVTAFRFVWWTLASVSPAVVFGMAHWRRLVATSGQGGTATIWLVLTVLQLVTGLLAAVGAGFVYTTFATTTTNYIWAVVTASLAPLVLLVAAVPALRPDTDVTWAYWPGLVASLALSVTSLVFQFLLKTTDGVLANYLPPLLYGWFPLVLLVTLVLASLESGGLITTKYSKE